MPPVLAASPLSIGGGRARARRGPGRAARAARAAGSSATRSSRSAPRSARRGPRRRTAAAAAEPSAWRASWRRRPWSARGARAGAGAGRPPARGPGLGSATSASASHSADCSAHPQPIAPTGSAASAASPTSARRRPVAGRHSFVRSSLPTIGPTRSDSPIGGASGSAPTKARSEPSRSRLNSGARSSPRERDVERQAAVGRRGDADVAVVAASTGARSRRCRAAGPGSSPSRRSGRWARVVVREAGELRGARAAAVGADHDVAVSVLEPRARLDAAGAPRPLDGVPEQQLDARRRRPPCGAAAGRGPRGGR